MDWGLEQSQISRKRKGVVVVRAFGQKTRLVLEHPVPEHEIDAEKPGPLLQMSNQLILVGGGIPILPFDQIPQSRWWHDEPTLEFSGFLNGQMSNQNILAEVEMLDQIPQSRWWHDEPALEKYFSCFLNGQMSNQNILAKVEMLDQIPQSRWWHDEPVLEKYFSCFLNGQMSNQNILAEVEMLDQRRRLRLKNLVQELEIDAEEPDPLLQMSNQLILVGGGIPILTFDQIPQSRLENFVPVLERDIEEPNLVVMSTPNTSAEVEMSDQRTGSEDLVPEHEIDAEEPNPVNERTNEAEQNDFTGRSFNSFAAQSCRSVAPIQYGVILIFLAAILVYLAKTCATQFESFKVGKTTNTPVKVFYAFFRQLAHITGFIISWVITFILILPLQPVLQIIFGLLWLGSGIIYFYELVEKTSASGIHVFWFAILEAVGFSLIIGLILFLILYLSWKLVHRGNPRPVEVNLSGLLSLV